MTRRTDSVALVVSERERRPVAEPFVGRMFSDPHFGRVVGGILDVLRPAGIQMVVMLADDEASRNQLLSYLRQGHVDGVVLISSHADDPLPGLLSRPDARRPRGPSAQAVAPDLRGGGPARGGAMAADLLGAGAAALGTVAGRRTCPPGRYG